MNPRTWVILGATSIIAKEFAHLAAKAGHKLFLVGRNPDQLESIVDDIRLRYSISSEVMTISFDHNLAPLQSRLENLQEEFDLFIAYSFLANNNILDNHVIAELIQTNVISTAQLIHTYLQKKQNQHHLLFLSSVAASRGRAKNSLYGGSKAAIEVYLQGLQQAATQTQHITIAKLGFIDTKQTYDAPGIFYASPPKACAKACWQALKSHKRQIYHPFFWRFIMAIITRVPFFIYKKMGQL